MKKFENILIIIIKKMTIREDWFTTVSSTSVARTTRAGSVR